MSQPIDPAIMAQVLALGGAGDKQALLRQQLAQAEALRRPSGVRYSTGIGGGLGALADGLRGLAGGHRAFQAGQDQRALLGEQDAARKAYMGLQGDPRQIGALGIASGDKALGEHGQALIGGADAADRKEGEALRRALEKQRLEQEAALTAAKIKAYGRQGQPKPASGGGQPKQRELPPTMLSELAGYDTAIGQVDGLLREFTAKDQGGWLAKVGAKLTDLFGLQGTDAAEYEATAAPVRQGVGTILEGGKMAAGDEAKYRNMMPRPGDSPEVAQQKVASLRQMLITDRQNRLRALEQGGYRTQGGAQPAAAQSPEDAAALEWARSNPSDPRAAQILSRLGVQ